MTDGRVRVAFDVTPVISGRTGIARYVTELGRALERCDVELRRFAIGRAAFGLPEGAAHVPVPVRVVEPWWRMSAWPPIERLARGVAGAEVVHATGPLTARTRLPLVVTIHDVAALRHPELHPERHVRQQRRQLETLARASAIVSVSQATADDLIALDVPADRIVVAPLGVTARSAAPTPPPVQPGEPYLLTVGETSPRKGYGVLLGALCQLERPHRLVMAGPPAGDEELLRSRSRSLGVEDRITRLGAVSDSTLTGLYDGALALCFPSIAEGFGLPVLEAMSAGTPVIASDIPATRELAGDAAIYVAGDDERAWAQAITALASDGDLRTRCSERGRLRAAGYTWARTAAATVRAYELALGRQL